MKIIQATFAPQRAPRPEPAVENLPLQPWRALRWSFSPYILMLQVCTEG